MANFCLLFSVIMSKRQHNNPVIRKVEFHRTDASFNHPAVCTRYINNTFLTAKTTEIFKFN